MTFLFFFFFLSSFHWNTEKMVMLTVLLALLTPFLSQGASLQLYSVSYDKILNVINVEGGYSGGCVDHEWELKTNRICTKSIPSQQTALLVDRSTEIDNCEAFLSESLQFNATPFIQACGRPTYLKIHTGFGQDMEVLIERE
jgi:hypothetical protein